ncbi:magnesium transporter NIPA-domain-containing protein, partial [Leucosporidium creatinivorum]
LVAPLGSVALVANVVLAPLIVREPFRRQDLFGCFLAFLGGATVVYASKSNDKKLYPDEIIAAITAPLFLVYSAVCIAAIIVLINLSRTRYGDKWVMIDLGICALSGGFTVLATKAFSSFLTLIFLDTFRNWITYPILLVLISTAFIQVNFINKALQRFESRVVIPSQFMSFALSTIVGSAVLYREFDDVDLPSFLNFAFGCLLSGGGVYLLTRDTAPTPSSTPSTSSSDTLLPKSYSTPSADRTTATPLLALPHAGDGGSLRARKLSLTLGGTQYLLAHSPATGSVRGRRGRGLSDSEEESGDDTAIESALAAIHIESEEDAAEAERRRRRFFEAASSYAVADYIAVDRHAPRTSKAQHRISPVSRRASRLLVVLAFRATTPLANLRGLLLRKEKYFAQDYVAPNAIECELWSLLGVLGGPGSEETAYTAAVQGLAQGPSKEDRQRFFTSLKNGCRRKEQKCDWMAKILALVDAGQPTLDYHPCSSTPVPGFTVTELPRKFDGCFSLGRVATARNVVAVLALSPDKEYGALNKVGGKLRENAMNAFYLLTEQEGRIFVPGLVIARNRACLFILDREALRIAEVKDCWTTSQGFAQLAIILSYLSKLNIHTGGFAAFFDFAYDNGIVPTRLNPSALLDFVAVLPASKQHHSLRLIAKPHPQHTPFSRATLIYSVESKKRAASQSVAEEGEGEALKAEERQAIFKMQWVSDDRAGQEHAVFCTLEQRLTDDSDVRQFLLVKANE